MPRLVSLRALVLLMLGSISFYTTLAMTFEYSPGIPYTHTILPLPDLDISIRFYENRIQLNAEEGLDRAV